VTPPVVLAADAWPDAGLGHLSRSSALAAALADRGTAIRTLGLGAAAPVELDGVRWEPAAEVDGPASAVVLDSYRLGDAARAALAREWPLAEFDDAGRAIAGRLAIGPLSGDADDDARVAGPRFACLRRAFWEAPSTRRADTLRRALVTTGGGDPTGRARDYAAATRIAVPDSVEVAWVRPQGAGDPPDGVEVLESLSSLADELRRADIAVTGAGVTMVEAAALAVPCVAVALAANQLPGRARLAEAGAVAVADDPNAVRAQVAWLAVSAPDRRELAARASALVDGRGALRVADRVAALATA
jgi:spore coat polysaccharide biosynthesis predicted glycosyltransferase SpsG